MSLFLSLVSTSALAMLLQAAPAAEAATENPAQAAQAEAKSEAKQEAKPERPERICRTIRNTGMRTAARQCKTKEQWERMDSEAATDQDLQMKTGQLNPG